jgi:hypothetical protein
MILIDSFYAFLEDTSLYRRDLYSLGIGGMTGLYIVDP